MALDDSPIASRKLKGLKYVVLALIAAGVLYIMYYVIMFLVLFGTFDKDYSTSQLVDNYYQKEAEIRKLRHFFNDVVPTKTMVDIEFENDQELYRLEIKNSHPSAGPYYHTRHIERHVAVHSAKLDSIIQPLGWSQQTLQSIKRHLDKANCISIQNGEPTVIGFQRSGMGMYFFNVFDQPIPKESKKIYNDSCRYIMINERLVLEYGSGAIGSHCFYNFD